MLKVIDDESAIKKYRRQFVKSFKPFIDDRINVHLGHSGGAFKAKVFWSNRLGIWMHLERVTGNRCGHAFGVGKPSSAIPASITCEINFPSHGIDRRIGGALAKDRCDRVFVVHRGKIGGGKKGVGKSLFEKHYRGTWSEMEDGDTVTAVALVGVLNSPRFVRQVTQFVRKVNRMKEVISQRSSQLEITFDEPRFREEFIGTGYDRLDPNSDLNCDQGLVVSDLHAFLKSKGHKLGNDIARDLFIINAKGRVTTVFQVITEHSAAIVQSGMANLLLKNVDLQDKPCLILAVPTGADKDLSSKLKKLGIDVLEYEWQGDQAVFPGLPKLISP